MKLIDYINNGEKEITSIAVTNKFYVEHSLAKSLVEKENHNINPFDDTEDNELTEAQSNLKKYTDKLDGLVKIAKEDPESQRTAVIDLEKEELPILHETKAIHGNNFNLIKGKFTKAKKRKDNAALAFFTAALVLSVATAAVAAAAVIVATGGIAAPIFLGIAAFIIPVALFDIRLVFKVKKRNRKTELDIKEEESKNMEYIYENILIDQVQQSTNDLQNSLATTETNDLTMAYDGEEVKDVENESYFAEQSNADQSNADQSKFSFIATREDTEEDLDLTQEESNKDQSLISFIAAQTKAKNLSLIEEGSEEDTSQSSTNAGSTEADKSHIARDERLSNQNESEIPFVVETEAEVVELGSTQDESNEAKFGIDTLLESDDESLTIFEDDESQFANIITTNKSKTEYYIPTDISFLPSDIDKNADLESVNSFKLTEEPKGQLDIGLKSINDLANLVGEVGIALNRFESKKPLEGDTQQEEKKQDRFKSFEALTDNWNEIKQQKQQEETPNTTAAPAKANNGSPDISLLSKTAADATKLARKMKAKKRKGNRSKREKIKNKNTP